MSGFAATAAEQLRADEWRHQSDPDSRFSRPWFDAAIQRRRGEPPGIDERYFRRDRRRDAACERLDLLPADRAHGSRSDDGQHRAHLDRLRGGTDPAAGYNVYVNGALVSSTTGTSATVGASPAGRATRSPWKPTTLPATSPPGSSTSASTSDCPSASNSPIYWGAWIEGKDTYSSLYGGTWGNAPWDSNTWSKYNSTPARAPSIVHWGVGTPWDHSFSYWAGTLNLVQNKGALNLLDIDTGSVSLSSIASGSEDSAITTWAQQAAAYKHPFFLRFNWEMNGGWFPWGTTSSNANTPADYVAAWRHIHDIFTAAGAGT